MSLSLTLDEEPGSSSLEVPAWLAEVEYESVGAGVSLPGSLLVLHHNTVRLVLMAECGALSLVQNSPDTVL